MTNVPLALLVGFAAGFLGSIPPGPLSVTVVRTASRGALRDALKAGLGGALIDAVICGLLTLGFSWLLAKLTSNAPVQLVLALFLVAFGTKILVFDRKKDAEVAAESAHGHVDPHLPAPSLRLSFLVGLAHGAANPTLIVTWTIAVGFLVGRGYLRTDPVSSAVFSVGTGIGTFAWFLVLVELVHRLRDHSIGRWLRESTVLAGALLLLFGLWFTSQVLREF